MGTQGNSWKRSRSRDVARPQEVGSDSQAALHSGNCYPPHGSSLGLLLFLLLAGFLTLYSFCVSVASTDMYVCIFWLNCVLASTEHVGVLTLSTSEYGPT